MLVLIGGVCFSWSGRWGSWGVWFQSGAGGLSLCEEVRVREEQQRKPQHLFWWVWQLLC